MKTTITDVAKQAGVSMKTVSRVLNNEPNVAKATRDRVLSAASDLRYRPNFAARGLASSRSFLIALLYDNPNPSYITDIQRGAIEACREKGYHLVLEPIDVEQSSKPEAEILLRRLGVDGVILTPPLSASEAFRKKLDDLDIRYVSISPGNVSVSPSIRMDDKEAASQMTRYLVEQGHTDIGFVSGPTDHAASAHRLKGFSEALASASLTPQDGRIRRGDFTYRSGVRAAESLLSDPQNRPTAIFASNDDMAAAVVSVAARMGIEIPADLAVCGFDDTPIARIIWPKLTTVAQPTHEMGRKAAEMLMDKNGFESVGVQTLDFKIVVREST